LGINDKKLLEIFGKSYINLTPPITLIPELTLKTIKKGIKYFQVGIKNIDRIICPINPDCLNPENCNLRGCLESTLKIDANEALTAENPFVSRHELYPHIPKIVIYASNSNVKNTD